MSSQPPSQSDDSHSPDHPSYDNSKLKTRNSKLALICVGSGGGTRFGGDKLEERLGRHTVFATALAALARACPEAPVVVVVPEPRLEFWRDQLSTEYPGALFVAGGLRRQDSVRAGVESAAAKGAEVVLVHDAARPLVHPDDVRGVLLALGGAEGAILSTPVPDTVKRTAPDGSVIGTVSRDGLRLAQTPQVFRVASLVEAWHKVDPAQEWTDESALLELAGMRVRSVVAGHPNPKLTTESDLKLLQGLLRSRS
jgi:2-C-methyl-D-erythritol 4-phosphate cytidylyltransferase